MKRFLQGISIVWATALITSVALAPAAEPGKSFRQKGGGRGGGNGGAGPWAVSVMLADAPGDRIRSDGTMYVDGVQGVDAFIRSGGDLQVELGGKNNAVRHVAYDFGLQTRVGQCVADGNCNCEDPALLDPPFVADDNGGWFRINMLDGEPGMHELALGASSAARYTSSVPGLGLHKKDPECTVRSETAKNANPPDATIRVTRTSETGWLIESLEGLSLPHSARYQDDPISNAIDHGTFEMPFSLTVACLDPNACPGLPGQ